MGYDDSLDLAASRLRWPRSSLNESPQPATVIGHMEPNQPEDVGYDLRDLRRCRIMHISPGDKSNNMFFNPNISNVTFFET